MADIPWGDLIRNELGKFSIAELPPTLELPALPHAATKFAEKANNPKIEVAELARILETDSGLTVELLRFVNSSCVGLRSKAKTAQHALTLLGRKQARIHIITTATQAAVRAKKSKLINQATFWTSSLQKALFAREVAKLLKADPDVAFAGGMLQDFLLPVISNELYETYLKFVSHRDQHGALNGFEQGELGWDHALAAAALALRWKFPEDLICCMLFQHFGLKILGHPQLGRTPVAAVALSALLPDELRQHRDGMKQLAQLSTKWKAFDLAALAEEVDKQQDEVGLAVRNPFPLQRMCRPALQEVAATV